MTPPAEFAAWIACLAFLVMLLNQGFKLKGNMAGSGAEKREVTAGFEPASRRELEGHIAHNSRTHDIIFAKIEKVEGATGDQVREMNGRLSAVEASLENNIEFMRQQFGELSARLDRKIERDQQG